MTDAGMQVAEETSDVILAFNEAAGLPMTFIDPKGDFLPPVIEGLDTADYLVLCGHQLGSQPAAIRTIRHWLLRGGILWVMLDRVDVRIVELLLGDGFDCQVVDRVGMTSVRLESKAGSTWRSEEAPRFFDMPVDFVRVLTSPTHVCYTLNGWPAAFWKRVGLGRVLFTTLGPRGWLRPRVAGDPNPSGAPYYVPVVAADPLVDLSYGLVLESRQSPSLRPEQLQSFVSEQVGYEILPQGVIFGVLGAFCCALAVAGGWLRAKRRAEWLTWIGPALGVIPAIALVVMGSSSRRAVPSTVSVAQVVYAESGVSGVHATGLLAMYNQRPQDEPVGARGGGTFDTDMTGLEGQTRRMVWTDLDNWHWENLKLPAGLRMASFDVSLDSDEAIVARGVLGPEGLTGTLKSGLFEGESDALIVLPWGRRLGIHLAPDGTFSAGSGDVLAEGQFTTEGMLDDLQRRRQTVYQELLAVEAGTNLTERSLLMFWADPLEMNFTLPRAERQLGSALAVVPFQLDRTLPGSSVVIPSPFITFRCVRGLDKQPSGAYSNHRAEWIKSVAPTRVWLRFQMPEQILPVKLDRAELVVKIDAFMWNLDVCALVGQETIPLGTGTRPVGTLRFDIDRPDALQLDGAGGLVLGILVSQESAPEAPPADTSRRPSWRIYDVQLEVRGTTQPGSDGAAPG
jgi:hypothetical protein